MEDMHVRSGSDAEARRALARDLRQVRRDMRAATRGAHLEQAAGSIRSLAHRLLGHVPARPLTRLISMLNDALTRRAIELACADARLDSIRWCWIALGSEGRREQTFASDQDNGIIFDDDDGAADTLRTTILPLASRINMTLAACGFPLCSGGIMASNPRWCLGLHEWRERFLDWIVEADPQALLNATIFFDLRPLHGDRDLAHALSAWLAANASDNPRFLLQMTGNALRRKPPLGVLHDFALEKGGEFAGAIDLKCNAATLFVDAARIYGLACGSRSANTADRFTQAVRQGRLDAADARAWTRAFYVIQALRLKNQQSSHARGAAMHNHVYPGRLDEADRRALLDSLRQARAAQRRLGQAFVGGEM
jgi:CBS domain-containing protein